MMLGDKVKKLCYLLALLIVFLDQGIKILVSSMMNLHDSIPIIKNFFFITYLRNDGAAFSILQNKTYLFLIVAFLVLCILLWYINKQKKISLMETISFGLLMGGTIGNFIDRLFYGQVIDYLDFRVFGYDYPVFNLADSAIVIGALILLYLIYRSDFNGSKTK